MKTWLNFLIAVVILSVGQGSVANGNEKTEVNSEIILHSRRWKKEISPQNV